MVGWSNWPIFQGFVFEALIVFALIMGLFDGCFISLLGPIAFDIVGPAGASQAIGFLLSLCSIPLTVGPPIAGMKQWLLRFIWFFNSERMLSYQKQGIQSFSKQI